MAQTKSKSCNKFNSFRIVTIKERIWRRSYKIKYFLLKDSKKEFGEGRIKLSIFYLKTEILLEFLRLGSKLFHSVTADGKKELFKTLCFVLIRGKLPTVLVTCGVLLTGIRLKRYFGCSFLKTL